VGVSLLVEEAGVPVENHWPVTNHWQTWSHNAGLTKPGLSGWNSLPISAEIALLWLQSEIKVALFLFASRSFLVNNLSFMVKLIDKAIVINVKIHKNERKRLYSSNKENLTCWDKSIMVSWQFLYLYWRNSRLKLNPKSKSNQTHFLYQMRCWIVSYFLLF
jgi:hypothetical protein